MLNSGVSQKPVVNFIGFQLYWWSCILLQNNAIVVCSLLLLLHLLCHRQPQQEFISIALLGLAGFAVDFILTLFDCFAFAHYPEYVPPVWLLLLWIGFATNVTTLSSRLKSNWWLMSIAGALLAPLSYLAAAKLNAVTLPYGYLQTWLILVPIWFLLLPSLFYSQYKLEDSYLET